MGAALLDTTVLIDALRGRAAVERLRALRAVGDVPCTSAVNVEEVVRGLLAREIATAHRLFDGLRVAPLGRAEGELAGTWRRDFARRGVTLAQADCLIAAAALGIGARLATGNPRDFPMRELTVDHWPVDD
jgi:predicted nucleic acid-binding protein